MGVPNPLTSTKMVIKNNSIFCTISLYLIFRTLTFISNRPSSRFPLSASAPRFSTKSKIDNWLLPTAYRARDNRTLFNATSNRTTGIGFGSRTRHYLKFKCIRVRKNWSRPLMWRCCSLLSPCFFSFPIATGFDNVMRAILFMSCVGNLFLIKRKQNAYPYQIFMWY